MPFVRVESSIDLEAEQRFALMHAVIACTAQALAVPQEACRASFAAIAAADYVTGTGPNEPWTIAYAHLKAGRNSAVKRHFTDSLFDLLANELGVQRSSLRILITKYDSDDWNNGGDATPL